MSVLVFDVGGTHLRSAVFGAPRDGEGALGNRRDVPTPNGGEEALLAALSAEGRAQIEAAAEAPKAIGLAIAGCSDTASGRVYDSAALSLHDTPIGPLLSDALGLPVRLVNDVNAAAFAEAHSAGVRDLVAIFIGTGVGAGCVSGGTLMEGHRGMAAEGGHVIWREGGLRCDCGVNGCYQAYLGGNSLARRAAEAGLGGDAAALFAAHRAGDARALPIVADALAAMGSLCRLLVTLFDPERVVIAGGIGMNTPELLDAALHALHPHPLARQAGAIPVLPATHGADAGLLGAALLALDMPP